MKKNKIIKIEKPLFSPSSKYDFSIGKEALLQINLMSEPMAEYLKLEYILDTSCLSGDIIALFELTKDDYEKNNRREFEN